MVRWHEAEFEMSRQRRASAVNGVQGNGGGGGNRRRGRKHDQGNAERGGTGGVKGKLRWTKLGRRWADRAVRHQAD